MNKTSEIYESKNGKPEDNMSKVIDMIGGIENIIEKQDIVILKPNAQWWNQGTTNTNAMKEFIELILNIPNYKGEIIIAENHHSSELINRHNIKGWSTQLRNGDYNLNELIDYFRNKGYKNVTKYHWIDTGKKKGDKKFKNKIIKPIGETIKTILKLRGKIVTGPEDGDGYVWTDIEYTYKDKKTKMTYPIFTSQSSKTKIDFKNGAWKNGEYTNQPIKFINFASLNHHLRNFAGVTSSIKNYLGIVDLSCGYIGVKPKGYYNFHHIGIPGMGGAIATFMKTIRKADLNIVTAEWTGYGSRTNTKLAANTKTIIASTDPVALDYYGAKHILYPLGGSEAEINNPDNKKSPFRKYLELCCEQGIGTLNEKQMKIHKFDFKKNNYHNN